MNKTKELHLILLWNNARAEQNKIIEDISKNLEIQSVYEIEWSEENYDKNLSRFYGLKLDSVDSKKNECGTGSSLLITVLDNDPIYEYIETSRGHERVNITLFNLKEKYRKWTGGGHKIHATNSIQETDHDITLLLGINYKDYFKKHFNSWDGKIKTIQRDLTGTGEWESLEHFFYTLNATTNYLVLRNFEYLPAKSEEHGDIDLLVENFNEAFLICNAKNVFDIDYRVHCYTRIAGEDVLLDLRNLGDNYYCDKWEQDLLENRVICENKIYTPSLEHHFYSLIYHAIIHKIVIASDYFDKLSCLFNELNLNEQFNLDDYLSPFDLYLSLLNKFMEKNHYFYSMPNDLSVHYDGRYLKIDSVKKYLSSNYNLKDIQLVLSCRKSASGYIYFTAFDEENKKIFIKWGGLEDSAKREYLILKELYNENPNHFPKPIYYKLNNETKFIALEYINGISIKKGIDDKIFDENTKELILNKIFDLINFLQSKSIIHRDLKTDNFILTDDKELILIDFQFAVNTKLPKENEYKFIRNKNILSNDDMLGVLEVIDFIGPHNNYITTYNQIRKQLSDNIGKLTYKPKETGNKILNFIISNPRLNKIFRGLLKRLNYI